MSKFFAFLLVLLCIFSFAAAEDMDEEYGEVVLGDPAELSELLDEMLDSEPYIPDDLEKTIFGSDDRTTIKKTSQYPYSAIAYLKVKAKCGCNWTGSGFMVSKYGMLTAAHCLVCKEHNQWVDKMTAYFGYRSSKNYTYRYKDKFTYWYGTNPYSTGRYDSLNDYAYLKLNKNVAKKVGAFGIRYASSAPDGQYFNVAGYRDGKLKTVNGRVSVYSNLLFKHNLDTEPGNSGGPVFDNDYYAVGINVSESASANYAHRITADMGREMHQNGLFD